MNLLALLILAAVASAEEVPGWVIRGVMATETRSTIQADGSIDYVDHRRGAYGERGCAQISYRTWRDMARPGERFADLDDPYVCMEMAMRYLVWLKAHHRTWDQVAQAYHRGPHHRAVGYLRAVKDAGTAP